MSKIRILAVEDDELIAESLILLIEEMGYELIEVVDNGQEALRMHKAALPDLVLMDIKIKGQMNGIEVAHKMNDLRPTPIIFLTSLTDSATFKEAKEVLPLAYLNKPFNEVSLQYAIELAVSRIGSDMKAIGWQQDVVANDNFFVKDNNHLVKVSFSEIGVVMVQGKYVDIQTADRTIEARISLKELESKLPRKTFMRVHRNYLINLDHLTNVDLDRHELHINGEALPIGTSYRDSLLNRLNLLS